MLPFDAEVEVYAESDKLKFVRRVDNIRSPEGEHFPFGLALTTMRVTAEWPFLFLLFLFTPGLLWRRRAVLLGKGMALLFASHLAVTWMNAMAASYGNGNMTVNMKTGEIYAMGPNPWQDALTHVQYTGPVLALMIWVALVAFRRPGEAPAVPDTASPTKAPAATAGSSPEQSRKPKKNKGRRRRP
jgi:hypothetical protein